MGSNANGANDFIPNSFQTPNILVDRLMPLLLDAELRCVIFAFRQIYGWEDARPARSEVLSISDFEHGTRGSVGVGLGRTAIINALHGLSEYRVMVKVGEPTREGQRWSFGSSAQIDWAGLRVRAEARKAKRRGQTTKARMASRDKGTGQLDRPVERSVGQTEGESVGQTSERSVGQTSPPYIEKLKEKPNAETNHAAAKTRESIGEPPDAAAAEKVLLKKALDDLGLAKSQHAQVLALDPAVALALIWDAQARGKTNPAGLLRTMVKSGDVPPVALRELAEFAIREGVRVKAEAETAWRRASLKALVREAEEIAAERKAGMVVQPGDEAKSDTVTDMQHCDLCYRRDHPVMNLPVSPDRKMKLRTIWHNEVMAPLGVLRLGIEAVSYEDYQLTLRFVGAHLYAEDVKRRLAAIFEKWRISIVWIEDEAQTVEAV